MRDRLDAGALDRRLMPRKRTVSENASGEDVEAFVDLGEVSASKTDVKDDERVRAQQVGATITTRFRIRWTPTVATLDARDRCDCEGREYEITAVKEIGRRVGLEITAWARADQLTLQG